MSGGTGLSPRVAGSVGELDSPTHASEAMALLAFVVVPDEQIRPGDFLGGVAVFVTDPKLGAHTLGGVKGGAGMTVVSYDLTPMSCASGDPTLRSCSSACFYVPHMSGMFTAPLAPRRHQARLQTPSLAQISPSECVALVDALGVRRDAASIGASVLPNFVRSC